MKTGIVCLLLFLLGLSGDEPVDPEHPRIATSSQEFMKGSASALKTIQESEFEEGVESPGLGASSNQEFQKLVSEINTNVRSSIDGLGRGDSRTEYDVILQPGHYMRTTGRTGTQGKYVSEQALVAYITNITASNLRRSGKSVLVVAADNYLHATNSGANFNGLHSKIFLALHADGSERPCSTGPSLGYRGPTTAIAMTFVALGLADALGYQYNEFRKNFTANEANYYMFAQVRSNRLTGLLEVGELTCEKSEQELINSSHAVGANVARAIDFILHTQETGYLEGGKNIFVKGLDLQGAPSTQAMH